MIQEIIIYTDGSSMGNPGPGGYGAVLIYGSHRKEISQGFKLTTNNRMELKAVIEALKLIKSGDKKIKIYTDSQYVCHAVEKGWLFGWQKKGYTKIKNPDLWIEFSRLYHQLKPRFFWVKGHAGNIENERCDFLATSAAQSHHLLEDHGYKPEGDGGLL